MNASNIPVWGKIRRKKLHRDKSNETFGHSSELHEGRGEWNRITKVT